MVAGSSGRAPATTRPACTSSSKRAYSFGEKLTFISSQGRKSHDCRKEVSAMRPADPPKQSALAGGKRERLPRANGRQPRIRAGRFGKSANGRSPAYHGASGLLDFVRR